MSALLKSLVGASEKSARIPQLCRQEEALFQLLIEEKTGTDKNKKFVQDCKTLADVLIQEVIKHDVGKEFPELHGHICGEESNKFENSLAAIHQEVALQDPALDTVGLAIPPERLAIWIDPIDSTNQYIRGQASVAPVGGICPSGLRSALVLIGAYDRSSGDPVLGVINEPFFREDPVTHRAWYGGALISFRGPVQGLLCGIALIVIGIYVQIELNKTLIMSSPSASGAPIVIIVVGVVIFFVSFFGCCGASKENYCMVTTFAILLTCIFLVEIAAAIAGYIFKDKVGTCRRVDPAMRGPAPPAQASLGETCLGLPRDHQWGSAWVRGPPSWGGG
ncbi:Inositol polyphosphate 1-phosphatase [Chelonia mydas]|uniref:inositol-1,4-bisphosphate 1-phosphatase n=1 Tax=Chelonia mydas TaxID=8469 RepID=M7B645_CHEMY|nr:Inositol polyphosphate 1-phosphatase [Chelonia mydas]